MPSLGRPDVDALQGLTAAIIVDQERMGANARSTVGTATDAYTMLRIVFSRLGQPHVGSALAYSFTPRGPVPLRAFVDRAGDLQPVPGLGRDPAQPRDARLDGPRPQYRRLRGTPATPAELVASGQTLTAEHLRAYVTR